MSQRPLHSLLTSPSASRFRLAVTSAVFLVAAGALAAAPTIVPRKTGVRILLVGLDGADWQIADPLIEAGRLPVLARLKKQGAWAPLRSVQPMLSPLLWTSLATGLSPAQHGIIDFLVRDPRSGRQVPISSRYRKRKALWNLYSDAGLTPDFIGWWATWPAEATRGVIVSDRVAYSLTGYASLPEDRVGLVSPESLLPAVEALRAPESQIGLEEIRRFAPFSQSDFDASAARLKADPLQAYADPLNHLVRILASTKTYHAIALKVLKERRSDIVSVYYQGIDEVCHRFAQFIPPKLGWVDGREFEKYREVVARFYEYQDSLLGALIESAGNDVTIVVVSDHGFLSGSNRPDTPPDLELKASQWHRLYGVLVLAGNGIRPGPIGPARLYDVPPTLMYLSGLPVPADIEGRPILDAIEPSFASRHPVARVDTYEDGSRPVSGGAGAPDVASARADEEMLMKLKALGYVGAGDTPTSSPDLLSGDGSETVTNLYNAATLQLGKGDLKGSEATLLRILARAADHADARALLSEVLEAEGRLDESMAASREALDRMSEPTTPLVARYVRLAHRLGRLDEARSYLAGYARIRPARAEPWVGLGTMQVMSGDRQAATASFLKALDLDPRSGAAVWGLYNLYENAGRPKQILGSVEKAVAANPDSGTHHTLLGMIYTREGFDSRAEAELRRALTLDPDRGAAIAALADVLVRTGRTDEARALLGKALARDEGATEIRLALGRLEARSGRMEEASRQMSEAVKRDPGSPLARAQYGMLLAAQDRVEPGIEHLRQALALDPSLFDLRLHLASMYLDAGRHRECEEELLKAVAERPTDPRPHEFLVTLYEATGRSADATRERTRLRELGGTP